MEDFSKSFEFLLPSKATQLGMFERKPQRDLYVCLEETNSISLVLQGNEPRIVGCWLCSTYHRDRCNDIPNTIIICP